MVKTEVQEYVYHYPWDVVTEAMWRKYPNPLCPHVLEVDVIARYVDGTDGSLRTCRLFTGTSPVPKGFRWLVNDDVAYAVEESVVDPKKKYMELQLKSLTFADIVEVNEVCRYEPHPDNDQWTMLRQEWSCEWKVASTFRSTLEKLSVEKFKSSVTKGRQALQNLCQEIERKLTTTR